MVTTVRIDGLRQLGLRMRNLSADIAKRTAGSATGAAANVVKGGVRKNIRSNSSKDGDSIDEGSLLKSVISKKLGKRDTNLTSEHIVTYRKRRGRKAKGTQAVAPHALFVEFGTVNMPAEPNLRTGFEQTKQAAAEAMAKRLSDRIAKEEAK